MALSTNLISGLSSGFDWRTMIDQLMEVEHRPVDLVESKKTEYEDQLKEWQSFNTQLLSLKSAVGNLKDPEDFYVYTSNMSSDSSSVEASDLLSISTSSAASRGTYAIKVTSLATAQKLSSASFTEYDEALGSAYAGDILINGTAVNLTAEDDLAAVRDKINNANRGTDATGVTASIISYDANDYRLVLNSEDTGIEGIGLQNGSSSDLVELFGWKDKTEAIKSSITGGAQSDLLSSTTQDIKTLLGLSTTQSGTVTINGTGVAIDLSSDSLEDIKTAINDATIAGVTASIITDTSGSTTTYRLQIDGTQAFIDDQNILETLGVLEHGVTDVQGTTSGNTMTVNGTNITSASLLASIDGYNAWTSGDEITISGTDHAGAAVSDTFSIGASSTVQDLMNAIETAFETPNGADVSVYVTSDGKIEIADMEPGASSLSATLTSIIADGSLDWGTFTAVDTVRTRQLVAGSDATVEIDGVEVTSSDNTVDDVLPGVTVNLLKADTDTTVTLNVDRDIDTLMEKFSAFVEAYNEVFSYINEQQDYDEDEEETGGILFADGTLSSVKTDLSSRLIESVWGVSSDFAIPGLVGINLDNEGMLSIDEDTLRGYLQTNFNDVRNLFAANGTTSAGSLEYLTSTRDTEAGEYTVNITHAASQSTSTSDTAVSGTLGSDEILTITEGDKTATISLTSDMTMSDIINAANTELDTVYTETLIGDQLLYEGSGGATALSATTTWDQVYIDSSTSASLADGDVISFSGTTRAGEDVSGSYTINDASSDTVQGLLSEIESAYGNDVDASIDSSGKLVLTDDSSGGSDLSISFDYSQAHDLTFGSSVSTTNTGGQEGRYSMDITASNSGSDELVLTHDNYGGDYGFTISETAELLWTTAGDETVNNGVDVAGTINGESAMGSGRVLTGDDGETNIDGLSIKYTGSATGEIGTVKLTLGTAELFDRALYNITDAYDGYVAFKQDSLEDNINRLETKIENMEDRLDAKMERMIKEFVRMEVAMSKIQSQSQWLSGQLDAAASAWG